jgi:hypothetical protein
MCERADWKHEFPHAVLKTSKRMRLGRIPTTHIANEREPRGVGGTFTDHPTISASMESEVLMSGRKIHNSLGAVKQASHLILSTPETMA